MNINECVKECHQTAVKKGWWDKDRDPLAIIALIHSELSEAVEELRICDEEIKPMFDLVIGKDIKKPAGVGIELVDAVIRIWDYFGKMGWDFEELLRIKMEYNKTRKYRHGGKKY